jgi:cyclopropane-fatty-acyl-phospholipid synthase
MRSTRERFFAHLDEVKATGFDDRFERMWDYYLSICEASFRTGTTQDLQIAFEKKRGVA